METGMSDNPDEAYRQGLRDVLRRGSNVPSVLGKKSKASNFGRGDRPWLELRGYHFKLALTNPTVISSEALPTHVPYAIGLLAWTLDGRNDVETLAYYRPSAMDFSDDGLTLCGSFGRRLFGAGQADDQMAAIARRIDDDPMSRRTFAPIISASDNLDETLEFPCATGVQLFNRQGNLHWLTVMRAQQALTVLPYDLFLFTALHHFTASRLGVAVGGYEHFAGTFHIYQNEKKLAQQIIDEEVQVLKLPRLAPGSGYAVAEELISLEKSIRECAERRDAVKLSAIAGHRSGSEFNQVAQEILVEFAQSKMA
jgi:thymidylate synthase